VRCGMVHAVDEVPMTGIAVAYSDCGTICAPSLMAVVGQYVQWAGNAACREANATTALLLANARS